MMLGCVKVVVNIKKVINKKPKSTIGVISGLPPFDFLEFLLGVLVNSAIIEKNLSCKKNIRHDKKGKIYLKEGLFDLNLIQII
jgi:hypothetical protein